MKAMYRCLLCGAVTEVDGRSDESVDRETALDQCKKVCTTETGFVYTGGLYHPGFYIRGLHGCPDGSLGILHFAGFKMEENEEAQTKNGT